jgi:hypothetical protein
MPLLGALATALQPWQNFYVLVGTAAATLTGLMFVAVTFGSGLVTRETAQTTRAFIDPTYMHFVEVLLIACLLLMPTLGAVVLGCLLIMVGTMRLVSLHTVFRRYREAHRKYGDVELSDWTLSIVFPLVCHLSLAATGAAFIARSPAAPTGLAVVSVALLFIGIHGAWELMVWMALAVSERRRGGSSSPQASSGSDREPPNR